MEPRRVRFVGVSRELIEYPTLARPGVYYELSRTGDQVLVSQDQCIGPGVFYALASDVVVE